MEISDFGQWQHNLGAFCPSIEKLKWQRSPIMA